MGSSIFQSRPGTVKMLNYEYGTAPGTLLAWEGGGPGGAGTSGSPNQLLPIVVTGVGYDQSLNIQFMTTLRKVVYVYSFGDRIGDLRVSGIAFDRNCADKLSGWGTRSMFKYYRENKAIKDNQQIKIILAGEVIAGSLVGMSLNLLSADNKTMGFSLDIKALP